MLGFSLIKHTVQTMSFEEFQYGWQGGNLGYWNCTILTILSLHVAPMPTKERSGGVLDLRLRASLASLHCVIEQDTFILA